MKKKHMYLVIFLLAVVFTTQEKAAAAGVDDDFTGWENHYVARRLEADMIRIEQGAFVRPTQFETWRSVYWVKPNTGATSITVSVEGDAFTVCYFKQDGTTKSATLNNGAFEASFGLNNGKAMTEIEVIIADGASDRSYYLDVCAIDPQRHDVVVEYYGLLPYPQTHNTTRALVDQIMYDYKVTSERVDFVANYLVGSQKNLKELIVPVKAINPNWHSLHYHLAIWNGDAQIIIDNKWTGSEWQYLTNDLFNIDPHIFMYAVDHISGETTWIKDLAWGANLMNISNENYYQYLMESLVYQCESTGYESIFFDSFALGVVYSFTNYNYVNFGYVGLGDPSVPYQFTQYPHPQLGNLTWLQASEEFISRMNKDMNRRGIWLLPNHGNMTTSWDPLDYALTNGGMLEGVPGSTSNYDDWVQVMSRTMYLTQKDRVIILQPNGGDITILKNRLFLIGEYLMVRGNYTYMNMCMSNQSQASWYPEYEIDLGAPTETYTFTDTLFIPRKESIDKALLYYQEGSLFVRRFEKGMVILNPTSSAQQYTIPSDKTYKMAVINGGGTVPESGIENLSYSLNWTEVTGTYTLPNASALILQFDNPTGLTETMDEKVNVYASNGAIQITSDVSNPIKEVTVYNLQGMLIYQTSAIRATSHTADLKQPAGIYIVKVITEKHVEEVKVFLN